MYACSCYNKVFKLPCVCSSLCLGDMASLWYKWVWVQCPKCKVWIETLAPLNPDDVVQETRYCGKCTIWWYDMHNRVWWPATRAYIVMLARRSVEDNPSKAVL